MAFKFNPFTGTFDEVGTGGGGVPDPLTLNELTVNTLLTADHIHGNLAGSVYIHVKNTDSVPLDAGTPFYITGTVGASDRVEIQKADSAIPAKGPAVGVLETTLAVNGEGNGVILGEVFNFDTATPGWGTNDALYVANGGGLTNVKPTSGYRQIIAYVGRIQQSTGTLVLTGTSVDPVAGSDTQIQYNDNGGFGASTDLTWNNTSKELGVGGDINLDSGGNFATTIQSVTPTANRTISFPDATGTVALVSGANGTIQYNDAGTLKGNSDFTVDPDWNDAATVFTGLKLNVTDGAGGSPVGNSDSKLLDLQSGGTSKFYVKASGTQLIGGCTLNVAEFSNQSGVPTVFSPLLNRHFFSWSNFNRIQLGADVKLNWSNVDGNANAATDVGLVRSTAGVIRVTNSSTGTGYIKQDPVAISALPDPTNATGVGAGTRGFVNDASSTTFAAVVAVGTNDGGSTVVPVYSDGTSWRIG